MGIHIFYANVPGTAAHAINYRGTITGDNREKGKRENVSGFRRA